MLRFEYSKSILEGLFAKNARRDSFNVEIRNEDGDFEYDKTKIIFPMETQQKIYEGKVTSGNKEIDITVDKSEPLFSGHGYFIFQVDKKQYKIICSLKDTLRETKIEAIPFYVGDNSKLDSDWHFGISPSSPITIYGYATSDGYPLNADGSSATSVKIKHNFDTDTTIQIYYVPEITLYLGLFISGGEGYELDENCSNYIEPQFPEYQRARIHGKSPFKRKNSILGAALIDENGIAKLLNEELIIFPEARGVIDPDTQVGDGWGKIIGFGIFCKQEGGLPFIWGDIKTEHDTPVIINGDQVPVVRSGGLTISIG